MGNDGTAGLRMLKRSGCFSIAQDEASCVVFGMPKEAIQAGVVDTVAPLERIGASHRPVGAGGQGVIRLQPEEHKSLAEYVYSLVRRHAGRVQGIPDRRPSGRPGRGNRLRQLQRAGAAGQVRSQPGARAPHHRRHHHQ